MELTFDAIIMKNPYMDASYIEVPYEGKGRLLVEAVIDGVPYRGQVVRMGTSSPVMGIPKKTRALIGKSFGDSVHVTLREREKWKCPKCGREFANRDQDHYCGKSPETIEEYIQRQDEWKWADLTLMYGILRKALPGTRECISWSMPTFRNDHNIVHFAASKKHIGFYPGPEAVSHFAAELKDYDTDKGTIRIPYGKVDAALIGRIAAWCLETGNHA